MATSGRIMARAMAQNSHFATFWARSLRAAWAVRAKRCAVGAMPFMRAYFRRIPRTTRSAATFTTRVIQNSSTPVRNSTR